MCKKRGNHLYPIAESYDGGLTWQESTEVDHIEIKSLPLEHCGRLNTGICYRLTRSGVLQVLGPEDEWKIVEEVNTEGYDMILFNWNEKEYVIVAIGEYGTLRRELPDGEWKVVPVLWAANKIENE